MIRYILNIYTTCIVVIAISVHLLVLLEVEKIELNSDIKSAIRRARTSRCKDEFINFAHLHHIHRSSLHISRTCNHDQHQQRNVKKGCASNSSLGLVKIDEEVTDLDECLELCFSYRHSYGGFHNKLGCYCGDEDAYVSSFICSSHEEFDWYQVNSGIFQPTFISSQIIERRKVKIVFLFLLSGRLITQVSRLFNLLYSENHLYYFHVDSIDELLYNFTSELERKYSNVIVAKDRYRTIWGSPLLLRVMINSMKDLTSHDWNYLINLSESDFPLKSLNQVEDYLSSTNSIYLKSHNIRGYHFIKKQGLNKHFYQCEDRVWRLGSRVLPTGIIYGGGSDWFALPKDFCDYIVLNEHNSSSLVKPLIQLFNYTLLPAESFFHTIVLNSEYCDRFTNNNLRLTNWNLKVRCKCEHRDVVDWCGCSPQVYGDSDKNRLKQASLKPDTLFSRKFDPSISSEIIDYVEKYLVNKNSTELQS